MYGLKSETKERAGKWLCEHCHTWNDVRSTKECPFCSTPRPVAKPKPKPTLKEGEIGASADNPIPLWDRMDILKALERGFGEDYFINGESVITTNAGKNVKLIQLKLSENEYKNIYFAV